MPSSRTPISESALAFELDVLTERWSCAPAMLELYGVPEGQPATTALMTSRMVDEDRDQMLERFRFHTTNPGPFQYEYRIRDHADRVRHLVLVGVSEDAGGQVKRLSGYLVDITASLSDEVHAAVTASAEHRAVIEQSKGILMAGFGLSADAAFALLRKCSNEQNVRLATVSQRIVDTMMVASFNADAAATLRRLLTRWDIEGTPGAGVATEGSSTSGS